MTRRQPIVVGYDGSDESRGALLWALREAAPDQPVKLVAVLGHEPSPLPVLSHVPSPPDEVDRVARRIAERWNHDGRALGHVIDLEFARGHPAATLARIADDERAELIVVGHRRHRRLAPLRVSVVSDLTRMAGCPVVVVP